MAQGVLPHGIRADLPHYNVKPPKSDKFPAAPEHETFLQDKLFNGSDTAMFSFTPTYISQILK
jgi:hypothetical protein